MLIGAFVYSQQSGTATYYGKNYHLHKTASGQTFNMYKLTCAASNYYKFGTKLLITNIVNNKSVIVEVNDRGSGIKGHKIDLSEAAFKQIANLSTGTVKILIKVL